LPKEHQCFDVFEMSFELDFLKDFVIDCEDYRKECLLVVIMVYGSISWVNFLEEILLSDQHT